MFDFDCRQFVIAPSVYTLTDSPPVGLCTPTDGHSRLRKAAGRASNSNRHLPSERHPAVLPAPTNLDDHIRLVEDRIRELEACIGAPNSPRMSSSRLFNTGASAVKQRRQLPEVLPTRRRRTLPPIPVAAAESVPRSSSRPPPDDVPGQHNFLSPVIDSPISEKRHHSKKATTLPPDVTVSTPPNAHRRSKLRPQRTPAASETDDSSTSDNERHTTRKKKFHPRHNKEDEHKSIRRSRSIGENTSPGPQEKGKPVKSLEDAAAKLSLIHISEPTRPY